MPNEKTGPFSAIKNFFSKKKSDAKFKRAGATPVPMIVPKAQIAQRQDPTNAEINAGNAAIARFQNKNKPVAVKPKVPMHRTADQHTQESVPSASESLTEISIENAPLANEYVKFTCELFDDTCSYTEINDRIHEYLLAELANEPVMASALIIQTLNKSAEKIDSCVNIISKYIDNIAKNPDDQKYRCIRMNNKTFQDKVYKLHGVPEYLDAVGFTIKSLPGNNSDELEDFYVYTDNKIEELLRYKEILLDSEPIIAQLDRSIHVFYPSDKLTHIDVPKCFYNINIDDIKKDQEAKRQAVEKLGMLRTKEMRERERLQSLRKYRYTLIRVKFPDSIIVQGTFKTIEKVSAVYEFVTNCMKYEFLPFTLSNLQNRQSLNNSDLTLAEADLAPATIVLCNFDPAILKEVSRQRKDFNLKTYIRDDLMQIIENL